MEILTSPGYGRGLNWWRWELSRVVKILINNFKDLRRVFLPCFSFLRESRAHDCPLHLKKIPLQDDLTFCRMVQGYAVVYLPR